MHLKHNSWPTPHPSVICVELLYAAVANQWRADLQHRLATWEKQTDRVACNVRTPIAKYRLVAVGRSKQDTRLFWRAPRRWRRRWWGDASNLDVAASGHDSRTGAAELITHNSLHHCCHADKWITRCYFLDTRSHKAPLTSVPVALNRTPAVYAAREGTCRKNFLSRAQKIASRGNQIGNFFPHVPSRAP